MYKKLIIGSLVTTSVMFSGCGSSDTTCRIDVQNAIDTGEYETAEDLLTGECQAAYTESDLNMNLASIYMGRSGYSVSNIADMLINSDNEDGDAFASFLSNTEDKKRPDSLPLLKEAEKYYLASIALESNATISSLCSEDALAKTDDSRIINACLYIGFNETIKTASTISYLTNDMDALVTSLKKGNESTNSDTNEIKGTPDDMRASLDALKWIVNANASIDDANISAKSVKIKGYSYGHLEVVLDNNKTFYRLAKSVTQESNNSTVITNGYCDTDGNKTSCDGIENEDGSIKSSSLGVECYACPVVFDTNDSGMDVAQLLVDSLNGGTDTIAAVSDDEDIKQSIDDFRDEINGGDTNKTITIDEIIEYLNNKKDK